MFIEQKFQIPHLEGISAKTIEEHLKLYAGYVKNTNLIIEHGLELAKDPGKNVYELGELQRRFGFEWGGMRNHEIYFSLLEGGPSTDAPTLIKKIEEQWNSFDIFLTRMKMLAMTRGVGWAMLYYDKKTNTLIPAWLS